MPSLPAKAGARRGSRATAAGLALAMSALAATCGGSSGGSGATPAAAAGPGRTQGAGAVATPGPAGPQRPACGLVTQAEVEAALGARVAAGHESVDDRRSVCSYALAAGGDEGVIITSTTSPGAGAAFAAVRDNLGGAAQPLDAGDKAFAAGAQAAVLKGSTLVAVLVTARQARAGAAAKMAQSAAARLS